MQDFGIGAIIGGILIYFTKGWIDHAFAGARDARQEKRTIANAINDMITEGESSSYQKSARSRESIVGLANKSLAYSDKLEMLIRKYDTVWMLAANAFDKKNAPPENLFFYRELEMQCHDISDEIRAIIKSWIR